MLVPGPAAQSPASRDEQGVAKPFATADDRKSVYAFGVVRVALSRQPAKVPTLTVYVMGFEGDKIRMTTIWNGAWAMRDLGW